MDVGKEDNEISKILYVIWFYIFFFRVEVIIIVVGVIIGFMWEMMNWFLVRCGFVFFFYIFILFYVI